MKVIQGVRFKHSLDLLFQSSLSPSDFGVIWTVRASRGNLSIQDSSRRYVQISFQRISMEAAMESHEKMSRKGTLLPSPDREGRLTTLSQCEQDLLSR
jgi:hypothetical protein